MGTGDGTDDVVDEGDGVQCTGVLALGAGAGPTLAIERSLDWFHGVPQQSQ